MAFLDSLCPRALCLFIYFLFYYITEGLESVLASLRHGRGKKSAKLQKMVTEVMAATVIETHGTVISYERNKRTKH